MEINTVHYDDAGDDRLWAAGTSFQTFKNNKGTN